MHSILKYVDVKEFSLSNWITLKAWPSCVIWIHGNSMLLSGIGIWCNTPLWGSFKKWGWTDWEHKLSFATLKRQGKCSGFSSIKLWSACNYVRNEYRSNTGHSNSGIFKKAPNKLSNISFFLEFELFAWVLRYFSSNFGNIFLQFLRKWRSVFRSNS